MNTLKLALVLFLIPLCSCGTDRALSSIDQETALQALRETDLNPQAAKPVVASVPAAVDHNGAETTTDGFYAEPINLYPDEKMPHILRDEKGQTRTIGKPALSLDPNAVETQQRYDHMK